MKKTAIIAAILPLILCSCAKNENAPLPQTAEELEYTVEATQEPDLTFDATMESDPALHEVVPADPLASLGIQPSDFFTPGVWTSLNSDDAGNFYIFDEDGMHGRLIPMSDSDGVDFTYSIKGTDMTMYVGEDLTPYSASLEKTDDSHVTIHMTFLGTSDELTYLSGMSAEGFTFYPARKLSELAERYYYLETGIKPAGVEYIFIENDMLVLNIWVRDSNGWRSDVESYTVNMFTAAGWSSITFEDIDLSTVPPAATEEAALSATDDIADMIESSEQ